MLKLIYDLFPDIRLFVSGSGSFDVKVPVAKYLVGRALIFELYPLTFEEFIEWKAKDLKSFHTEFRKTIEAFLYGKKEKIEPVFENEFKMLLEEYIIYGGFPAVVKEQDKEVKIQLLKSATMDMP